MSFQFILSGEYQQNFDLNFKRALRDIATEEGCYVLCTWKFLSECRSSFLIYIYIYTYKYIHIQIYTYTNIYIYIYIFTLFWLASVKILIYTNIPISSTLPIDCKGSPFLDKDHNHIITGNLKIITNNKLHKPFSKSSK